MDIKEFQKSPLNMYIMHYALVNLKENRANIHLQHGFYERKRFTLRENKASFIQPVY